jgi:hypothetical protein
VNRDDINNQGELKHKTGPNFIRVAQSLPIDSFNLPIFATSEFLKLKAKKNNYGYFYNDNFALPFFIRSIFGIKRLKFTESILSIEGKEENVKAQKSFLDGIIQVIEKDKIADFIDPPAAQCIFKTVPDKSEAIEWGSYVLDSDSVNYEDDVINLFPKNFRNQIRKAVKNGVTVTETDDIRTVYEIISDTFTRQRSPYSPSYEFLLEVKNKMPNNSKFYLAKKDNEAVGTLVLLYNDHGASGLYSGSAVKTYNCMNLIHYKVMEDLEKLNINKHYLGGARPLYLKDSKFAGIQLFKKGMGAKLERGYIFVYERSKFRKKLFYLILHIYLFLTGKKFDGNVVEQIKSLEKEFKSSNNSNIIILQNLLIMFLWFENIIH